MASQSIQNLLKSLRLKDEEEIKMISSGNLVKFMVLKILLSLLLKNWVHVKVTQWESKDLLMKSMTEKSHFHLKLLRRLSNNCMKILKPTEVRLITQAGKNIIHQTARSCYLCHSFFIELKNCLNQRKVKKNGTHLLSFMEENGTLLLMSISTKKRK